MNHSLPPAHPGFRVTVCVLLGLQIACGSPDPGAETDASPFSDITARTGLDFVHDNGMTGERYFVEIMGAGAALFDFDGDGDLDVYLVQGHPLVPDWKPGPDSPRDRLYRADLQVASDGSRTLRYTDVTATSGIEASGYGMGVATGDYNNDGWVDLYVLNWGPNQLWRNNGDGTFTDVTRESGTDDPSWSTGGAFLDLDLDGHLDLVVIAYNRYTLAGDRPCYAPSGRRDYCGPDAYPVDQDRLFRNRGDGTFEDVTLSMGLGSAQGPALGVIGTDVNRDGWPDIYLANDRQENRLWINRQGKRFQDAALISGVARNAAGQTEASMGVVAEDFDADGDDDLFMTHLDGETNTYYANEGGGLFEDRTRLSGLGAASREYTGFGVAPVDYDNDGWLDLFVANGAVTIIPEQAGDALPLKQRNQLFRNLGRGEFREIGNSADPVLGAADVSRGVAYGDIDNDGDTDILVSNNNDTPRLLRNDVGHENHWLGLRILVRQDGRDAIGARVGVARSDAPVLFRRVHTDGSYASAHDPRVLVGLEEPPEAVHVRWLDGSVEVWEGLELDRYHTLVRGQGRPRAETP